MTGDFRLALVEDFDEIAYAYFSAIHQVEEAQARPVRERREKQRQIAGFGAAVHDCNDIRIDRYVELRIHSP